LEFLDGGGELAADGPRDAVTPIALYAYTKLDAVQTVLMTRSFAVAEGPREALVSRNPATTKHLT